MTTRTRRHLILAILVGALTALWPLTSTAAGPGTDPYLAQQWNLTAIRAPDAWSTATGAGTRLAVIDNGVEFSHPDLAARMVTGTTFMDCEATPDGCGDGDVSGGTGVQGFHGTHVAGIAAADTGNGVGIAGVAPEAGIMSVMVGETGARTPDLAAGIRWAVGHGADVINLSLGNPLPGHQVRPNEQVWAAARYAADRGVVIVAAAGNDTVLPCAEPSWYVEALCVVAVDRNAAPASYSNRAIHPTYNVVAAPGGAGVPNPQDVGCDEKILSTFPTHFDTGLPEPLDWCRSGIEAGYGYMSGTSMAAPHVAGVAALLAGQCRTAADIISVIRSTARNPVTGARGAWDPAFGYGLVDAAAAVAAPINETRTMRRPGVDHDHCVDPQ